MPIRAIVVPALFAATVALADAAVAADGAAETAARATPVAPAEARHDPLNPAIAPRRAMDDGDDDDTDDGDDVEVIRHGQREGGGFAWRIGAAVAIGLEDRLDGAVVRTRERGDLIDGEAFARISELGQPATKIVGGGLRERSLTVAAGTDPLDDRQGRAFVDATAAERGWRGELPLYAIAAHGGYARDRHGLFGGDAMVALAHVGVDRDDSGRWYRVGLKYLSPPRPYTFSVSVDRVISYQLDDRFYATETRFGGTVPLTDNLAATLGAAYMHAARNAADGRDHTWEGSVALVWRLGSDL